MQVCAYLQQWTPGSGAHIADLSSIGVQAVAMPWEALAPHVSRSALQATPIISAIDEAGAALRWIELPALTCLDSPSFESQTDDTYMRMQVAQRCGAKGVITASGHRGSIGFGMSVAALTRLAVLAERQGLLLSARNVYGSAIEQPDALHVLFRDVRSPALRLCLDNVQFQLSAVNPADAAFAFSGRTAPVRLGDTRGGQVCPIGDGNSHVEPTIRTLIDEGFEGELVLDAELVRPALPLLRRLGAIA